MVLGSNGEAEMIAEEPMLALHSGPLARSQIYRYDQITIKS